MTTVLSALLVACLIWWISTGVILLAVRLAESGGRLAGIRVTFASLPVLFAGCWLLWISLDDTSAQGAYLGFLSALAIWGWFELSFLAGAITGSETSPCPSGLSTWQRFRRAWRTVDHHELTLAAFIVLIVDLSLGSANIVGTWTLLVLYLARISAKLNLFFGVAHVNIEFLPRHLSHLSSHFGTAQLNWLFPVSISVLTFGLAFLIERLINASTVGESTGFALLAGISALALLEHWFLVLPWPDAKLWRWMLPKPNAKGTHELFGVDP